MYIIKLIESAALAAALSTDALAASFAYGSSRIHIPKRSIAAITLTCSAILAFSMLAGSAVAPWINLPLARGISFAIMLILGAAKIFDGAIKAFIRKHDNWGKRLQFRFSGVRFIIHIYANPEDADSDRSRTLSVGEAVTLSAALSIDGLAIGFGAGMAGFSVLLSAAMSLVICPIAVAGGCALGYKASKLLRGDISWVSGVILILLAVMKLI